MQDPEFAGLPSQEKRGILGHYFDTKLTDDEFHGLPDTERAEIRNHFLGVHLGAEGVKKMSGAGGSFDNPLPDSKFGALGDMGSGLAAGVLDFNRMAWQTARALDPPGGTDVVRDFATDQIDELRGLEEDYPRVFKPSKETQDSHVRKAIYGGFRAAGPSLGYAGLGLATGGVAAAGVLTGGIFAASEFDQYMDDAAKAGKSYSESLPYALASGAVEGGGEALANVIGLKIFGLTGIGAATFKNTVKQALFNKMGGFFKNTLTQMPVEVSAEFAQNSGEQLIRNLQGISNESPLKAGMEAIGPAMVMTLLFGGGSHYLSRKGRNNAFQALADENAPEEARWQASNVIGKALEQKDKELANQWTKSSGEYIGRKLPIPIDMEISEVVAGQKDSETGETIFDQYDKVTSDPDINKALEAGAKRAAGNAQAATRDDQAMKVYKDLLDSGEATAEQLTALQKRLPPEHPVAKDITDVLAQMEADQGQPIELTEDMRKKPVALLQYPEGTGPEGPMQFGPPGKVPGEIRKSDGTVFETEESVKSAINRQGGSSKDYRVIPTEGGFIAWPLGEATVRALDARGIGPYLDSYAFQLNTGEKGQKIWLDPDHDTSDRQVIGTKADIPDWFRDGQKEYGWDRYKAAKAIEKGIAGRPFAPGEKGEQAIWDTAIGAAKEDLRRDMLEFGKVIENVPEAIEGLSDTDYRNLLGVLEDEGLYTRPITEAAALFRKEVENEAVESVSEELGISEEEFRATLENPEQPEISFDRAWEDLSAEDKDFIAQWDRERAGEGERESPPQEAVKPSTINEAEQPGPDKGVKEKAQGRREGAVGGQVHDYSSTQVNLPENEAQRFRDFGGKIPDSQLYIDPKEGYESGREDTPHITVKYGLDTVEPKDVEPLLADQRPIAAKLGKVSIFEVDNYDVVKVDIESPELHALNKKIADNLKVTDTYPDYKPHATIAYVKKGEGQKYAGDTSFEGDEITFDSLVFSGKDGRDTVIPLKAPVAPDIGKEAKEPWELTFDEYYQGRRKDENSRIWEKIYPNEKYVPKHVKNSVKTRWRRDVEDAIFNGDVSESSLKRIGYQDNWWRPTKEHISTLLQKIQNGFSLREQDEGFSFVNRHKLVMMPGYRADYVDKLTPKGKELIAAEISPPDTGEAPTPTIPPAEIVEPDVGKEAYKMRLDEYLMVNPDQLKGDETLLAKRLGDKHENAVIDAYRKGKIKSHPDYPDLAAKSDVGKEAKEPWEMTRDERESWLDKKADEYGSKNKFYASDEYKKIYPKLYEKQRQEEKEYKADTDKALKEAGLEESDNVTYVSPDGQTVAHGNLYRDNKGVPKVKIHTEESSQGKISVNKIKAWHKGWEKAKPVEGEKGITDQVAGQPDTQLSLAPKGSSRTVITTKLPDSLSKAFTMGKLGQLKGVPGTPENKDYRRAKYHGDVDAANRVVRRMLNKNKAIALGKALDADKPILFVPVINSEKNNQLNVLPLRYAKKLAEVFSAEVNGNIVKMSGKPNTDVPLEERISQDITFDGDLPGGDYQVVIVDDNFTSGKTVMALMGHLQVLGAEVRAVSTMAYSARNGAQIKPTEKQLDKIRQYAKMDPGSRGKNIDDYIREVTGHDINQFTGAEANAVAKKQASKAFRPLYPQRDGEEGTGTRLSSFPGRLQTPLKPNTIAKAREANPEALDELLLDVFGWLGDVLPQSVLKRIVVDMMPRISLKGQNVVESMRQHSELTQKGIGEILGTSRVGTLYGLIELSYNFDNNTIQKSTYHEAFHVAVKWLLPDADYKTLMDHFKGNEEAMANAFMDFAQKKKGGATQPSLITKIFRNLRLIFKRIRNGLQGKGYKDVQAVFEKIWGKEYEILPENVRMERVDRGKTQLQMAGERAIGAPTGQLAKAQAMLDEGKTEQEVWDATGWNKEASGKWAFRIDDSGAKVKDLGDKRESIKGWLEDYLNHPELFKAYPQLKDITIEFKPGIGEEGNFKASTGMVSGRNWRGNITVGIGEFPMNKKRVLEQAKSTLLHEISHAIQEIEGFARGGSPEGFRQPRLEHTLANYKEALSDAYKKSGIDDLFLEQASAMETGDTSKVNRIKKNIENIKKADESIIALEAKIESFEDAIKKNLRGLSTPMDAYGHLAGEIYAREAGAQFTGLPGTMEGIPKDQWLIKDGEGTSFSVEMPETQQTPEEWADEAMKKMFPTKNEPQKAATKRVEEADKAFGDLRKAMSDRFGKGYVKEGMKGYHAAFGLPYWLGKKFKSIRNAVRVEVDAAEERSTDLFNDYDGPLGDIQNDLPKNKKAFKEFKDLIWKWDRKPFPKKAVSALWHKEAKEDEDLEVNPEHYRQVKAYLRGTGASDAAIHGFLTIRRKLDEKFIDIDKTMRVEVEDPDLLTQFRSEISKVSNYFPHRRTGGSHVTIIDKRRPEGEKTVYREHYNTLKDRALPKSKKARARAKQWLMDEFNAGRLDGSIRDYHISQGPVEQLPDEVFFQVPVEAMGQIIAEAGRNLELERAGYEAERLFNKEGRTKEEALAIAKKRLHADMEVALSRATAEVFKSRGWARHSLLSKNIPGHETEDVFGILFDYLSGYAGFKTKIKRARLHSENIQSLNAKKRPQEYKYLSKYVRDMLANQDRTDRAVDTLRGIFFAKYLGFVVKSGMVNLTQNIVLAAPTLSAHTKASTFKLAKAMKDTRRALTSKAAWTKGKVEYPGLSADEQRALYDLIESGVSTDQYLRELKGNMPGVGWVKVFKKGLDKAGIFMSLAEKFNRASTGLAAYRVATKEKGMTHEEAVEFAKEIVYDSHFLYGTMNHPSFVRGGTAQKYARSMYTFRSFTHNYLNAVAHLWGNQQKKAVARSVRNVFLVGGLTSLPFFDLAAKALYWALGRDDEDPLTDARKTMPHQWMKDVLVYGLPGLAGVDLSGSISIEFPRGWKDLIGVPYSIGEDTFKTVESLRSGAYFRALSTTPVTPLVVRNAMRGYELFTEGQRARGGKDINYFGVPGTMKISGREAIQKGVFGLQPTSVSSGYKAYKATRRAVDSMKDKKIRLTDRFVNAYRRGDWAEIDKIKKEIREWNVNAVKESKWGRLIDISAAIERRLKPSVGNVPKVMRPKAAGITQQWRKPVVRKKIGGAANY